MKRSQEGEKQKTRRPAATPAANTRTAMDTSRAGLKEVSQEESESGTYVLGDDEHDDDDEDHDEDDDGQERRDTAGVFWQKALPRVELGTFALRVRRSTAKLQRR